MKSYTDLEQSRKLAEIQPVESADMCFNISQRTNMPPLMTPYCKFKEFFNMGETPDFLIPCWSLVALMEVLPHRIDDRHRLVSGKLSANEGWYVCYDDDNGDIDYYVHNSSLIDACVELILKLHEQKLL